MTRLFYLVFIPALLTAGQAYAQTTSRLKERIQQIVRAKNAFVGVAISGNDGQDTLTLNGAHRFPLQSVFKFHIAAVVLSEIDKGRFALNQAVTIPKAELVPDLYSPIRDTYPNGVTLTIAEILAYTVSQSDNVGCDVLLRLLGGPQVVDRYFLVNNVGEVSVKINEETQQKNWELQFQNWTTPRAADQVLRTLFYNQPRLLSPKSHAFLWKIMKETQTGKNKLRGQLPVNAVVAHKTGKSGVNKAGLTAAENDIGVVFLPDGRHFFISVFVTNSTESEAANEQLIADIARAAWDHFTR